jgi:hypothetical protein
VLVTTGCCHNVHVRLLGARFEARNCIVNLVPRRLTGTFCKHTVDCAFTMFPCFGPNVRLCSAVFRWMAVFRWRVSSIRCDHTHVVRLWDLDPCHSKPWTVRDYDVAITGLEHELPGASTGGRGIREWPYWTPRLHDHFSSGRVFHLLFAYLGITLKLKWS